MILHFDADAFFASVEQAADPKLRGRAIAVGGERRGVIASASYEARKMGSYRPMPTARGMKGRNHRSKSNAKIVTQSLNVKSCFSSLDSTLTIPAIIKAAVAQGMPAVAITDPNLHAAVPFSKPPPSGSRPSSARSWCDQKLLLAYVQNQTVMPIFAGYFQVMH
jgi:nucleotidyltransferase/DNA polymerase involved in DNA repair